MAGRAPSVDNWPARHPLAAALLTAAAGLLAGLGLLWITLPDVGALAGEWPERTAYMRLRAEAAAAEGRELRIAFRPVPLSRVPETVRRAVLVSEDAAFHGHGGFDWHELRAALLRAWSERSAPRGASTITQQLARNLYLSPRRSLLRKVREALIAWKLERELSKRRILELYLNVIELGPGIFGVEAASRRYFGKGVSELGPAEAAELAATIPSPLRHNPATGTPSFRWRAELAYRRAFGGEPTAEAPPRLPEGTPEARRAGLPAPDTVARDSGATAPPPDLEADPDTAAADPDTAAAGGGPPTPPAP